jgi:hypothetical protein
LSAAATIDAIHEQGGLAIAAHPYAYFPFIKELKGIKGLIADPVVGRAVNAVEVCNANPTEALNNHFTRWVNRRHLRRPEVGGATATSLPRRLARPRAFPATAQPICCKLFARGPRGPWARSTVHFRCMNICAIVWRGSSFANRIQSCAYFTTGSSVDYVRLKTLVMA